MPKAGCYTLVHLRHCRSRVVAHLARKVLDGTLQKEGHHVAGNPHRDDVLEEAKERGNERRAAQDAGVKRAHQVAENDRVDGVDGDVHKRTELGSLGGVGALHGPIEAHVDNPRNHADDGGDAPRKHEVDPEHRPNPALARRRGGGMEHVKSKPLAQRAENERCANIQNCCLHEPRRSLHRHE